MIKCFVSVKNGLTTFKQVRNAVSARSRNIKTFSKKIINELINRLYFSLGHPVQEILADFPNDYLETVS